MTWVLVLYFYGGLQSSPAMTTVGPYTTLDDCRKAENYADERHYSTLCIPVGNLQDFK